MADTLINGRQSHAGTDTATMHHTTAAAQSRPTPHKMQEEASLADCQQLQSDTFDQNHPQGACTPLNTSVEILMPPHTSTQPNVYLATSIMYNTTTKLPTSHSKQSCLRLQ
jgi:hypothetical protein